MNFYLAQLLCDNVVRQFIYHPINPVSHPKPLLRVPEELLRVVPEVRLQHALHGVHDAVHAEKVHRAHAAAVYEEFACCFLKRPLDVELLHENVVALEGP